MNPLSVTSGIENDLKERTFVVQDYFFLVARSVRSIFTKQNYFSDLVEQMDIIGVGSLRIVLVALLCVGVVVLLNAAGQFRRFGETSLTADAVSLALLRELGPVFTALLVAGRNATAMASELGPMVVTDQIDAIRAFGIDPIRKLMTPRLVATVIVMPILTALGVCGGLVGGFLVAKLTLHAPAAQFWTRAIGSLQLGDVVIGFVEPLIFGFIVASVGCHQGL